MTELPNLAHARQLIGADVRDAPTPALILDLPKVRANIAEMARRMSSVPAALRPHAKIHKSPILGQMQIDAGAIGLTTATVWEAAAMIEAGIAEVLIANQVVGPRKVAELARLASIGEVITLVDDAGNVEQISAAAQKAGSEVGILVELDVGLHRAGVRSVAAAVELAEYVERAPGVRLRGPFGYEGHCMLEPDRAERVRKAQAANAALLELADELEAHGLSTEIVAAGGLGTWDITGANPRITEIHAGSYIFSDAFHRNLVPGFEPALTVLATIISRSGAMAVLDCGRKSIGIDRTPPELVGVRGAIRFEHGEYFIHEEHTAIELDDEPQLAVGDTVRLMPGYSPTTVNFYDCYYVVEDGRVIDVWPVLGRYGSETAGSAP
ncbi:MAG: alanine racemase [Solirubrobacteraceae bacterium]|jgi:D-serine deaminase-like pyridoxal phosphate-dependent protein